jgi:hypothetical protein
VKVITGSIVNDAKFLAILLSLIIVPYIWIRLRKKNYTDHEGREPPVPDKRLTGEMQPRSNMPLFGPGMDYTYQAMKPEWEHPDIKWYEDKQRQDAEELAKDKAKREEAA